MGWTAGADVETGDLITSGQWNTYLGDSGSLEYLKTEADKHDDVTLNDVTATRALDTIYQNTSGKIKLCVVSVEMDCDSTGGAANSGSLAQVAVGTPPTVQVDECKLQNKDTLAADIESVGRVVFIVPINYYYRVTDNDGARGVVTLRDWIEYDLL